MKRRPFDLVTAQREAHKFVAGHISKVPLGLPEQMTEQDFEKVMNAITRAMATAWAAGYAYGLNPEERKP